MGRKLKNSDRGTAKFIRIRDESKWEVIDELMALDKFKSNFNKLINDALDYGLPKLYAAEFGIIEEDVPTIRPKEIDLMGENYLKLVRLLREIIINENINKSILCSLFHIKSIELSKTNYGKSFEAGNYQDTPDCLADYEIQALRKLRDKEDES